MTAVAEHNAILDGMLLSSIVTTVLVAFVLAAYFRSATLLVLLVSTLGIATTVAFGGAALTVGHLNAATAFLGAIIAGNGVNYGILLIARFLEERRGSETDEALAHAIVGTLRPTAVASLGGVHCVRLARGHELQGLRRLRRHRRDWHDRVCRIESYLLLPALVLVFGRRTRIFHGDPVVGGTLVRACSASSAPPSSARSAC